MASSTKLSYNEGASLPSDAPEWALSASQRIQEKLKKTGKIANAIPPEGVKKVLLHSCCAPCSGAMVEEMVSNNDLEDVVVFFYNPNIHPRREYEIRKVGVAIINIFDAFSFWMLFHIHGYLFYFIDQSITWWQSCYLFF